MSGSDQSQIIDYLRGFPKAFVSAMQVCKHAAGRKRYLREPDWAKPLLHRMEVEGLLESDEFGHYRLKEERAGAGKGGSKKAHRERRCCEAIKTYVLTLAPGDDDKPFTQMLREVVEKSFAKEQPDPPA